MRGRCKRLYELVKPYNIEISDLDMLGRLDQLYIDTRYPSDLGILPYGKPTLEDAHDFYVFALAVFQQIKKKLEE